jgi:hypothetical protein
MKNVENLGIYSFYAGLVLAAVATLLSPSGINSLSAILLGILGIAVGLLNVVDKEVNLYLIASIAFIVGASSLGALLSVIPGIGDLIPTFLQAIVIFVAPSAAIVSLKALWGITSKK